MQFDGGFLPTTPTFAKRPTLRTTTFTLIALMLFAALGAIAHGDDSWTRQAMPLLRQYCFDCHNNDLQESEVNLEPFAKASDLGSEASLWKEVLKRIEFGAMPPEDADQPSDQERKTLIATIEQALYGASCDLEPKSGKVTIRRLNRNEYNNTINDLLGFDIQPAKGFPSDEVGAGFDNNGDVLSLPPMLLEKYVQAAEQIAAIAIIDPSKLTKVDARWYTDTVKIQGKAKPNSFEIYAVQPSATIEASFSVPYEGDYGLVVEAAASDKGDSLVMEALIDGQSAYKMTFGYRGDGNSGSVDYAHQSLKLSKGKHTLKLRAIAVESKDAGKDKDADKGKDKDKEAGKDKASDKNNGKDADKQTKHESEPKLKPFRFKGMRFEGPHGIPKSEVQNCHWQLVKHRPQKGKRSVLDAAKENLSEFLPRAFRGPVDQETVARYASLVELAVEREETFERGMQVALTAALVSPRFLFRDEQPKQAAKPGVEVALTPHQLANRLAYFLWSSMPDEQLRKLADGGNITNDKVLHDQVRRLVYDAKGERLLDNFADQWLGLRNLADITPDPKQFPDYDDRLRDSMIQETRLTFLDCMRGGQSVLNLLDSKSSYLDERLAKYYGVEGVRGDQFQKVSLLGTHRAGILTQASILMLTSNPTRTSPVKRGKWVMENILGTPPPDPPAGVPELEETASSNPDAPLREQLAIHRDNAMCASCHRVMDQIGFSFEHYGVTGRWRDVDGKHPIDASGKLPSGETFDGAQQLIKILREQSGDMFVTEFTRRLMTFALGRELQRQDECIVDDIVKQTQPGGWKFMDIATAIVQSKPFRYQTVQ